MTPQTPNPTRPAAPGKPLGPEEIDAKTKGLFREFASVGDYAEAATCVKELRAAPKAAGVADLSDAAAAALEEIFDATVEKTAAALVGLLVRLAGEGVVTGAELKKGVERYTEGLEDLRWVGGGLRGCGGMGVGLILCGRCWNWGEGIGFEGAGPVDTWRLTLDPTHHPTLKSTPS